MEYNLQLAPFDKILVQTAARLSAWQSRNRGENPSTKAFECNFLAAMESRCTVHGKPDLLHPFPEVWDLSSMVCARFHPDNDRRRVCRDTSQAQQWYAGHKTVWCSQCLHTFWAQLDHPDGTCQMSWGHRRNRRPRCTYFFRRWLSTVLSEIFRMFRRVSCCLHFVWWGPIILRKTLAHVFGELIFGESQQLRHYYRLHRDE